MKIAITSRSFSESKELRQLALDEFDSVKFNDSSKSFSPESLLEFLADVDAAIISLDQINHKVLDALPKLRFISKFGVGLDNIDFKALEDKNISFFSPQGVNKRSVSELTLYFMLDAMRKISISRKNIIEGKWEKAKGHLLTEKEIGLIGYGHIGQDISKLLEPFNVNIRYYDIAKESSPIEDVLTQSDIVSLHIPLSKQNKLFFSKDKISSMKKGSYLINTSRGNIVDEDELYKQLKSGHLAGAYFDVLAKEPPQNNLLCSLDNFYLTPHIGGSATESILAMGKASIEGLKELIKENGK